MPSGKEHCDGMLAVVMADTPAAQYLGGFKEGVAFAEKPCRLCEISRQQLSQVVTASEIPLWDETEHRDRVADLRELSGDSYKYWSKQYGINGSSVLLEVPGFAVTKCLLLDPMHILLEGLLKYEFQLLLKALMQTDRLILAKLNRRIGQFEYSFDESLDRPQAVELKQLDTGSILSQTAAEMKTLVSVLPHLLEDLVNEKNEYWLNFVKLIHISHLCLSPVATHSTVITLRILIASHNTEFIRLYQNASVTPKMHYMVHFPDQIDNFGPMWSQWCMRYEANNGLFKSRKWNNFKNICYSLAVFHQRWMCFQMLDSNGLRSINYLYKGDEVGAGFQVAFTQLSCSDEIMHHFLNVPAGQFPNTVLMPRYFVVLGRRYQAGTVLLRKWDALDDPHFVRVTSLVVVHERKLLIGQELQVIEYSSVLGGFLVSPANEHCLLDVENLFYRMPQITHTFQGHIGVILEGVGDIHGL